MVINSLKFERGVAVVYRGLDRLGNAAATRW